MPLDRMRSERSLDQPLGTAGDARAMTRTRGVRTECAHTREQGRAWKLSDTNNETNRLDTGTAKLKT
eukprot:4613898-Pyramimonas_sp.AAC.1